MFDQELTLTPESAAKCAAACVTYRQQLVQLKSLSADLVDLKAFGTLQSGRQLGQKFLKLATGTDQSLDAILQQHIDIAIKMEQSFLAAGRAYEEADAENARQIMGSGR